MDSVQGQSQRVCRRIAETLLFATLTDSSAIEMHNLYVQNSGPNVAEYKDENRALAWKIVQGIAGCAMEVLTMSDLNVNRLGEACRPLAHLESISFMTLQGGELGTGNPPSRVYGWGDAVANPMERFDCSMRPYHIYLALQGLISESWRMWNALGYEDHMALDQRGHRDSAGIIEHPGVFTPMGQIWWLLANLNDPNAWGPFWVGFLYRLVFHAKHAGVTTWSMRDHRFMASPEALGVLTLGLAAFRWAIPRTFDLAIVPYTTDLYNECVFLSSTEVTQNLASVVRDASTNADLEAARNGLDEIIQILCNANTWVTHTRENLFRQERESRWKPVTTGVGVNNGVKPNKDLTIVNGTINGVGNRKGM